MMPNKHKLDKKDNRILYALDTDAHISSLHIAKQTGLSKDAVNYRIHRLEHEGVIKGYYALLNTLKLGYLHFNTLFRFRSISDMLRKRFVSYCIAHERVIWCVSCYGNWDFGVSFLARDLEEYDEFITTLLHDFGHDLHERSMFLMIESPTYTREYLIAGKEGKEFHYKQAEKTAIDELEHRLLGILAKHGRMNAVELAAKLKTTPDVVRYRIEKLTEKGIIQGFRAKLNIDTLGYSYYKLLLSLNNCTLEDERRFKEFCRHHPHIIQCIKYLGQYEFQIEVEIEAEKVYALIEEVRSKFYQIIKTYELLRLKEEKLDYYPFDKYTTK